MHPSSFVLLLALALPLTAQRISETEPNNSSGQAQVVALGSEVNASLTAGDEDWFQFTTTGNHVKLYSHGSTSVDTVFDLFDATGTNLLAVNDDTDGFFSSISINLAAGTYQLRVTGWGPFTTGSYQLEFGKMGTIAATGNESEPNDSRLQATPIGGGAIIDGSLSSATDEDWYRIALGGPNAGVWFEILEGEAPWVSNHRYEIYDSAGALLAPTGTFGENTGNSSNTMIRSNELRCWPAGTYYLVIKNSTSASGLGAQIPQGNYRLRLRTMPMGFNPVAETEPNNTIQTANPITLSGAVTATITTANGADPSDIYGPVTLTTPRVLQFQTSQGATAPLLDSTIRLLDENGAILGQWTFGNTLTTTSHARATVNFSTPPGTFYFEVLSPGINPSQGGSYQFAIGSSVPNYVPATYSIDDVNNACLGSNGSRPTIAIESSSELPVLGTNFSRRVTSLPPSSPVFLNEGLSTQVGLGGTIALPYDLGAMGAPNCLVYVDPAASQLYFGSPTGELTISTNQPNLVAFRGIPIFEQAIVLDLAANTLGLTTSNYARRILGDRQY